jgi:Zn-dependent peptidase ImmA (M78 family)
LAHELGHILLRHNLTYYESLVSLDNPPTEKLHTPTESFFETEASSFAGELLVPLDILKMEFKKTRDLQELSRIFVVSKEVIGIAISNHMNSLY